jgi:hypothetical protein
MSSVLSGAIDLLDRASSGLAGSLASANQWNDAQRAQLDRDRINPIIEESKAIARAMATADQQIGDALRRLG